MQKGRIEMISRPEWKRWWIVFGALACIAGFASACGGSGEGGGTPQTQANRTEQIRVRQTAPAQDGVRPAATEERLEQIAESVPDVLHANCVIFGNTAIVGIDVDGRLDRSRVGTVKYAVAEALKNDPVGINAIVTADMDLYHRLEEIRRDIANGRPVEGFAEELADIIGRIIPQLPIDTVEPEQPPPDPSATSQEQGEKQARTGQGPNRP